MKSFFIYKSSAGSGKTYTLVKEYIKIVLQNPEDFRHILAITFTNKAAEEMKRRIVERLTALSQKKDAKLEKQLIDEGVRADIPAQAKKVLSSIMHNYSYFSVSTIDSFFHRVIRSFARELKLHLGYNIEIDEVEVINKITDELLDDIGINKKLTEYLEEYVFENIEDEKGWRIDDNIKKMGNEIFKERYWEMKKSENGSQSSESKEAIRRFIPTIKDIIRKFESQKEIKASYSIEQLKQYNTAVELNKTIYIVGIFNDLLEKLIDYRDKNKLMLISDTNKVLREIISEEHSPFIYEKIGNYYKHFLIDEFQDTSNFQWKNLLPLLKNSLAENNFSAAVGDIKQSIFRWRGGNMNLLLEKIYDDLSEFKDSLGDKNLAENWRSRKEIVKFNNLFFTNASKILADRTNLENKELITDCYKDVVQKESICPEGGYVNITFCEKSASNESKRGRARERMLEIIKELKDDGFPLKDILILVRYNKEGSEIASFLNENGYRIVSAESLQLPESPKIQLLINVLKYISDNRNVIAKTEILFNYLSYITKNSTDYNAIFTDHLKIKETLFFHKLPKDFFNINKEKVNSNKSEFSGINPIFNNLSLYELVENLIRIFKLNRAGGDAYLVRFQDLVLEYLRDNSDDIVSFLKWWEENKNRMSVILPEEENAIRIMTIHKAKGLENSVVIIPYADWDMEIVGWKDSLWVSSDKEPFNQLRAFYVRAVKKLEETYFEKDYDYESLLTKIDNLNLLYVAFTRPIERLYLIVPSKGNKNAGKLIEDVINKMQDFGNNVVSSDGSFEAGQKEVYIERGKSSKIKAYNLQNYYSVNWHKKIVIKPSHEKLRGMQNKKDSDGIKWGIIVHEALSYLKTKGDMERAITMIQNEGLITSEEAGKLKNEIESVLKIEGAEKLFPDGWEIKTEAEILLPDGRTIRPDRVMVKNNKAIVIDYKTGAEKKEHREQINIYADSLQKSGYESVEKYILYISQKKLIKVQ